MHPDDANRPTEGPFVCASIVALEHAFAIDFAAAKRHRPLEVEIVGDVAEKQIRIDRILGD